MSAANSKIKFIILLISVILKLNFPCLVDEQPSEEEIKSSIQNLTVKSPLFDKSRERLARIGPPAVEYLIRALKDENWQIRTNAAFILGKIGDKRVHLLYFFNNGERSCLNQNLFSKSLEISLSTFS